MVVNFDRNIHGLAEIKFKGDIFKIVNENNGLLGMARMQDFSGTQQGSIFKEIATGVMVKENIVTNIEGIIMANGKSIPLTIKIEKKITSDKNIK